MLNKFKFIPLILISLVTFSFSVQVPLSSSSYDYRFKISTAGDMWLYNGIVDGIVEHCQYTQIENNPYVQPSFNETAFKKNSFYAQSDPASKSPSGYFSNPATLYKFLGYETHQDNKVLKYETYSWAKIAEGSTTARCVKCNTKVGEYFDSTTGLCVNKCEDISNRRDRFNCLCKRSGKLGFDSVADHVVGDKTAVCSYTCTTTKDDPEAKVGGDGNLFTVTYKIRDTDPNASGVCFTDDSYTHGTKPGNPDKPDKPNPDKPDKPNPDKPDKPNPDNPNPGGGGGKPGGGGGNPGGGGNKPDKPGDNNPGGGGGGKPGDKDDKNNPNMDFSGYDKLTKDVEKGVGKVMGMYDDAKKQLMGTYDKIKNGSLHDFKHRGFVGSCPYTRDFVIKDGLIKKITIDICAVVKDARPVLYFIFYAVFSTIFSILLFKIIIRLV